MRGSRISHLAITTFCWLPPDSAPTGMSVPAVRIASSLITSSISARFGAAIDDAAVAKRSRAAKERLSRTDMGSISPSVLRSSGISAMPTPSALAGAGYRSSPARRRSAGCRLAPRRTPNSASSSSRLALAVEAAEADDLAGPHSKRDVLAGGPSRTGCAPPAPAFGRRRRARGLGGKTWLYSRPIIISTTSLSVLVPAS